MNTQNISPSTNNSHVLHVLTRTQRRQLRNIGKYSPPKADDQDIPREPDCLRRLTTHLKSSPISHDEECSMAYTPSQTVEASIRRFQVYRDVLAASRNPSPAASSTLIDKDTSLNISVPGENNSSVSNLTATPSRIHPSDVPRLSNATSSNNPLLPQTNTRRKLFQNMTGQDGKFHQNMSSRRTLGDLGRAGLYPTNRLASLQQTGGVDSSDDSFNSSYDKYNQSANSPSPNTSFNDSPHSGSHDGHCASYILPDYLSGSSQGILGRVDLDVDGLSEISPAEAVDIQLPEERMGTREEGVEGHGAHKPKELQAGIDGVTTDYGSGDIATMSARIPSLVSSGLGLCSTGSTEHHSDAISHRIDMFWVKSDAATSTNGGIPPKPSLQSGSNIPGGMEVAPLPKRVRTTRDLSPLGFRPSATMLVPSSGLTPVEEGTPTGLSRLDGQHNLGRKLDRLLASGVARVKHVAGRLKVVGGALGLSRGKEKQHPLPTVYASPGIPPTTSDDTSGESVGHKHGAQRGGLLHRIMRWGTGGGNTESLADEAEPRGWKGAIGRLTKSRNDKVQG